MLRNAKGGSLRFGQNCVVFREKKIQGGTGCGGDT